MAKLNCCYLNAIVETVPHITYDKETSEPKAAMVYLQTIRSKRNDHSGRKYFKKDYPLVISLDPEIVKEIATWKQYDVVFVKGTVSSKYIPKTSYCPDCTDDAGKPTENTAQGLLMYITPIFAKKRESFETKKEAAARIIEENEVSNEVYVCGSLTHDPKYFKTKKGTIITQYQIALGRKYHIKEDDPEIRTDWPWVKSYGEQAIEDRLRLKEGSVVIIDGTIQARTVHRKTKCKNCGRIYPWDDHTLELVPYDVEYVRGYKTDDDLEAESGDKAEDIRQRLFDFLIKDDITDETNTEDDIDENSVNNDE